MGPGDPEMITVKALRELKSADHIFAPTIDASLMGRAEEVIGELLPDRQIERIVFHMEVGQNGVLMRQQSAERAAHDLVGRIDLNSSVAFVTLGDPALYSTFYPLALSLKSLLPDLEITMVPGIPAFTYLASKCVLDLLDNSERLFIVPVVGASDVERLRHLLDDHEATVVIYKCAGRFPLVRQALSETGRLDTAIVGEQLGTRVERIAPALDFGDHPLSYFATVISPAARTAI